MSYHNVCLFGLVSSFVLTADLIIRSSFLSASRAAAVYSTNLDASASTEQSAPRPVYEQAVREIDAWK